MDLKKNNGHIARRVFHLFAPFVFIYYLFPEDFFGFGRQNLLILVFAMIMFHEVNRLRRKKVYFGMREYEANQLSAYGWASIGVFIAFMFFPLLFVIPAITGIGWTDPLIGEMKRRNMKGYPYIPLLVYFLITFFSFLFFSEPLGYDMAVSTMAVLAIVGAGVAIAVEKPSVKYVDDDFLMMVVPLFVIYFLYLIL